MTSNNQTDPRNISSFNLGASISVSNKVLGISMYIKSDSDPRDPATFSSSVILVVSTKIFNSETKPELINLEVRESLVFYRNVSRILESKTTHDTHHEASIAERGRKSIKLTFERKNGIGKTTFFINAAKSHYYNPSTEELILIRMKLYETIRLSFLGLSDSEFAALLSPNKNHS